MYMDSIYIWRGSAEIMERLCMGLCTLSCVRSFHMLHGNCSQDLSKNGHKIGSKLDGFSVYSGSPFKEVYSQWSLFLEDLRSIPWTISP